MPDNQLLVSEKPSEEAQELVQQILENPNELGPAVQVRFAKRVGRPGASRVMMMDAQTVGPSGEENEDSESKLALRLADGTNVQVSLSFFTENQPALANAGSGGGGRRATYSPFNTYVYEPRSYNVNDRGSKLPAIMIGMAFVLGAASYGVFYLTGKVADHDRALSKATKAAPVASATARPSAVKAAKPATANSPTAKNAHDEPIPAAPSTDTANGSSTRVAKKNSATANKVSHSSHARTYAHAAHSEGNFGGGGNFGFVPPPPPTAYLTAPAGKGFVPPPPPTTPYMVPTGIPAPMDPLAALAPAVAHTKGVYSAPKHKAEPAFANTGSPSYAGSSTNDGTSTLLPWSASPKAQQSPVMQEHAPAAPVQQITPTQSKSAAPQLGDGFDIP